MFGEKKPGETFHTAERHLKAEAFFAVPRPRTQAKAPMEQRLPWLRFSGFPFKTWLEIGPKQYIYIYIYIYTYLFCLVGGKQKESQKSKKAKRVANSGEEKGYPQQDSHISVYVAFFKQYSIPSVWPMFRNSYINEHDPLQIVTDS